MNRKPITVLVVDDDPHVRELLKSYFEQRGTRSFIVESAEEALALPTLDQADVALLDLRLPGAIDGHALQQELNLRYPDMAKILMSGQADLEDAIAALSDQAFAFIKKPFSSLKEVGVLIERAAQAKRLEIQNRDYAARLEEANYALANRVTETTAETQRYQSVLSHLFQVSLYIGRIQDADAVLDFICKAVVEAGAFRQAVLLLADEKYITKYIGVWREGEVPPALRESLKDLRGRPLRPFEFDRVETDIGPAVYMRSAESHTKSTASDEQWKTGDQVFLPVMREDGSVFGFLSLEAPADNARPNAEIMQLLDVLLTHGALHLQAQRMRDELKQRAVELELRVHERTRDLRLSEERFSRLVNSTTDIVYVTDENDKLTFLNEAFTKTLGYVRENYIGRTLRRLLEELTTENPINHRALQELSQLTGEHTLHHVEVLSRQGDKRILEINRTIARQGGGVTGTQGIIRDITEHRVLLQQLVASERLAATGRLAAGIAHEINNPLQGLSSQLSTVEERARKKENISENIEILKEGIERIRHIVRGLLDLHRNPAAAHSPVQLNELVERVHALMGQQIRERSVTVTIDLARNLPTILASPPEVQQVLINLVLNALDAMPEGGELRISTQEMSNAVQISVRDNGIGIAAEHQSQIFEPFFTFKPTGSGTGLGLYLSKNIMDLHNGKISVESEKGKGACFILTFPRS